MTSTPSLPGDVEERLRAAHAHVIRGGDEIDAMLRRLREDEVPFAQYGYRDHGVLFHGESVEHLDAIASQVTRSALADGGFNAEALSAHVATACGKATADDAIAYLVDVLAHPEQAWTFGEALPTFYVGDGPHELGRCLVHGSLAVAAPDDDPQYLKEWWGKDFPARVITATVTAHDQDSAYLRAVDAIDEAKAILWLVSDVRQDRRRRTESLIIEEGRIRSISTGGEAFGHVHSTKALLFPPFTHISMSAAKDPDERTDWERRVIAATRWHYQAGTTTWPSSALTATMTALEALLLPGRQTQRKGAHLAALLNELGAATWGPADHEFEPWFADLYRHRNDATHEGLNYNEDLEVGRLLTISHLAIRWAATHLDCFHPSPQHRPCTTLDQALADHP